MSEPSFLITARGRTVDLASFVTDGSLILREDALRGLVGRYGFAPSVRELTTAQIGGVLATQAQAVTDLESLVPSRIYPNAFRTGDDVALGARYVALLRLLPGPIRCGTSGPREPVMLFDGQGLLGALMPVATLPENGERLPAPSPGARRARVIELTPDGSGRVAWPEGTASFAASALHVASARDLAVGGLLDCDLDRGVARALWPAGMTRPETVAPAPALRWPRAVVLRSLQVNGLLGEFDGGSFGRLLQQVSPATDLAALLRDEPLDEREIVRLLAAHYGPTPVGAAATRDGLLLPWTSEAQASVAPALRGLLARLGVAPSGALASGEPSVSDRASAGRMLAAALAAAGRPERVWVVGREASFLLIRAQVTELGPTVGAMVWG